MSETGYGDFEFERRFYVEQLPEVVMEDPTPNLIIQNYFQAEDGYALRVRVQAPGVRLMMNGHEDIDAILEEHADAFNFCVLTVKGPMNGGTRYEAERELDVNVGLNMVQRAEHRIIKNRYSIWLGSDGWVLDVFGGSNHPLLIAEVERSGPVTDLEIPEFCISEVTEDKRFSNETLSRNPFRDWAEEYGVELGLQGPVFLDSLGKNSFN